MGVYSVFQKLVGQGLIEYSVTTLASKIPSPKLRCKQHYLTGRQGRPANSQPTCPRRAWVERPFWSSPNIPCSDHNQVSEVEKKIVIIKRQYIIGCL